MRFLCLSDIHGHAFALSAVLAAAERRGWARLLVAGDHCFPGDEPLVVWRRLMSASATLAQGIGDRALATVDVDRLRPTTDHERERLHRLERTREELGELILARLGKLPPEVRIPLETGGELLLIHGSPHDAAEPFTHEMSDDELLALIGDDPADVIVCGGSHVPFDRDLGDVRIINVGSVGDAPGGGFAHGTFLETTSTGVTVEQFAVPLGPASTVLTGTR
jgi:predicted phosphodiesterase